MSNEKDLDVSNMYPSEVYRFDPSGFKVLFPRGSNKKIGDLMYNLEASALNNIYRCGVEEFKEVLRAKIIDILADIYPGIRIDTPESMLMALKRIHSDGYYIDMSSLEQSPILQSSFNEQRDRTYVFNSKICLVIKKIPDTIRMDAN